MFKNEWFSIVFLIVLAVNIGCVSTKSDLLTNDSSSSERISLHTLSPKEIHETLEKAKNQYQNDHMQFVSKLDSLQVSYRSILARNDASLKEKLNMIPLSIGKTLYFDKNGMQMSDVSNNTLGVKLSIHYTETELVMRGYTAFGNYSIDVIHARVRSIKSAYIYAVGTHVEFLPWGVYVLLDSNKFYLTLFPCSERTLSNTLLTDFNSFLKRKGI